MAHNRPTPAQIAATHAAFGRACELTDRRRFGIQLWHGNKRTDYYAPTRQVADMMLRSLAKPDDPKRPDRVLMSDKADTCVFVLKLEKSWFGYRTELFRPTPADPAISPGIEFAVDQWRAAGAST